MPHKVSLSRLKLTDFRNYAGLSLDLDTRHVVLTGENGAGKTNLMEAVSFLSPGRGLRRAAYADVAPASAPPTGFSVFAELDGMDGEVEIGTGLGRRRGRPDAPAAASTARRQRPPTNCTDHLRVLWLTPAMDGLFTGGSGPIAAAFSTGWSCRSIPSTAAAPAISSAPCAAATSCSSEGRFDPSWLTGIEQQMASLGIAMALGAAGNARSSGRLIDRNARRLALSLGRWSYPAFSTGVGTARPSISKSYIWMLMKAGRYRDAAAGRTLDGPHRRSAGPSPRQEHGGGALLDRRTEGAAGWP
jgi:DNA replication and repair protein RecF